MRPRRHAGSDYITIFRELAETPRVLYATVGRGADTGGEFVGDLFEHGGHPLDVTELCSDMSAAFIAGARHYLENAHLTFGRYHITADLNGAVDEVRMAGARQRGELSGTKYVWLKRPEHLAARQTEQLVWLTRPSGEPRHRAGVAMAVGPRRVIPAATRPREGIPRPVVPRRDTLTPVAAKGLVAAASAASNGEPPRSATPCKPSSLPPRWSLTPMAPRWPARRRHR